MLKERIVGCINEMETTDLIQLHNEYCDAVNGYDNHIYHMDDLDLLCEGQDAHWIACRAIFGDFNANDDYIMFDGYGNFRTLNDYNVNNYIYAEDIADYITENNNPLYNDDIQDILDEHESKETNE